ncbi:putative phosphatase regulatory subunit-domain-containing protein [Dactylonectria estremocensis]|uniref:Phosphatase regulatory subunit-domain-containing protein n=1 Tax=Dactylonectria estremocensis TaxID=1079267 RepID=A0A9P9E387_9HYPO|nr:putative phosphatase regulatory subunit-domain-containing protein [Dactylonectria estremocensis]
MPYVPPLKRSPCSSPSEKVHFDLPWPLYTKPADPSATPRKSEDAAVVSESEAEAEHGEPRKPRLIRKLSGEIVRPILRPPSCRRPASAPTSPTATKSVNFHSHLEETLDFFRLDCPMSISTGSQFSHSGETNTEYPTSRHDVASRWEIVTPNFPHQTRSHESRFVCLKNLRLLDDQKSLQGMVAVRNVAFYKLVTCRFTFDNWKTTSNLDAVYSDGMMLEKAPSGYEFFVFTIELSDILHLESKIAHLCVRYIVNGQEFWDNNSGRNFQVCFLKTALPRHNNAPAHGISLHPQNGPSKNPTPGRPTTSPFRRLDLTKCYSISASLDATVRATKCNNARSKHNAASMDAVVGSSKSPSSSSSQKSTISSFNATFSKSKFSILMQSGSNRSYFLRSMIAHTTYGDADAYVDFQAIPTAHAAYA